MLFENQQDSKHIIFEDEQVSNSISSYARQKVTKFLSSGYKPNSRARGKLLCASCITLMTDTSRLHLKQAVIGTFSDKLAELLSSESAL